jgi:O-antigen/teichoic acid export membrane protein
VNGVDIASDDTLVEPRSGRAFAIPDWASSASVAVVDQFLVSGVNFLTVVIVGRVCGAASLGTYSLAATLMLLLAALAEALITGPYAIHLPRMMHRCTEYGGSLLIHSCMLGGAATGLLLVVSKTALLFHWQTAAVQAVWPVALVALPITIREVARRHAFAHNRASAALILDLCVCSGQLIGLLCCAYEHVLSSTSAVLVIGASSAVSCVLYLLFVRNAFHIRKQAIASDLRLNIALGKWMLGSQVTMIVQFSVAQWAITLTQGPAQNGILMAASSVAMVANPALTGLSNLVLPKAARAVQAGGRIALRRLMKTIFFAMVSTSLCYCVLITIVGHKLVAAVYGARYTILASVLIPLSLTFAWRCVAMPAYIGLWVLLKARLNVYVNLIGVIAILLFIIVLRPFGVAGVAYSMMLGESITCIVRWCICFRAMMPGGGNKVV